MKTQILRVITRLNIGGPARQALTLTRDLGHEFHTDLVVGFPQPGEGELPNPDVETIRVPLVRSLSPRADLRTLRYLRRRLASTDYGIVHTHMAKAGATTRLAALSMKRTPKLVHTFHGHVLEGYFAKPIQQVFVQVERYLARRTDALVAVSDEVRDDLLNLGIGTEDRWRVIPLGFDLGPMLQVDRRSGVLRERLSLGDEPLVGVLGRLAPIKDHATLFKAVARLDGVHLVVLGDGELNQELAELASALGMNNRIHMLGWMTDVPGAIADMDVVALTSRNEGTPVSLIEAHACGRPVVATSVGGVGAVVVEGETGLLACPGDVLGVTAALDRLLADPGLRRQMGAAGREHVRERFTAKRLVENIRALYADLLR